MLDSAATRTSPPITVTGQPLIERGGDILALTPRQIRRIARARGPSQTLPGIVMRQAATEYRLWLVRKVNFRHRDNHAAVSAYCEMDGDDFRGINARQSWSNWRTIPRNLAGRLPNRPVRVIDLCCGIGESTEVLACYAAPGSWLLGLEYSPRFVAIARERSRAIRDDRGQPADVHFVAQSVLDTFRDDEDQPLADASIDLVNASGAVGCHFDRAATAVLAREVARVLVPGGLATIDSGKSGTSSADLRTLFADQGMEQIGDAHSCVFDRYRQLCMRKS
ncbi:MAG: class I SAM-dependent methyltransferase [Planctomycetes bacterium]|nr:class I SAM-dependent methyltransferase [Planctomycetota bacterium]